MNGVFITGGTGFIGNHLVRRLTASGIRCFCLVRSAERARPLEQLGASLVLGSVEDAASYQHVLAQCDTVLHLAGLTQALSAEQLHASNGAACGVLADACVAAGVSRVVYVSSLAAAGPPLPGKKIRQESDPETPVSDYGRSKLAGEHEFRRRADRLNTSVLRPGVVYGSGDAKLAQMIHAILRSHLHVVIGFRTPLLSLIHVDDLIDLICAAAVEGERLQTPDTPNYDPSAGIYFACDDREFVDYAEFGRRVAQAAGTWTLVWPLSRFVGHCVGAVSETIGRLRGRAPFLNRDKIREATTSSWACSSKKAQRQLRFQPQQAFDSRLVDVVATYRGNRPAPGSGLSQGSVLAHGGGPNQSGGRDRGPGTRGPGPSTRGDQTERPARKLAG